MILDFIKLFKMYALFTLSILMKLINLDQGLLGCLMRDSLTYFGGDLEAPHGINKGYSAGPPLANNSGSYTLDNLGND